MKANNIEDRMIQPGEKVIMFEVPWTEATRALEPKMRNLDFQICYASLLEEFWMIDRKGNRKLKRPCSTYSNRL